MAAAVSIVDIDTPTIAPVSASTAGLSTVCRPFGDRLGERLQRRDEPIQCAGTTLLD